MRPDDYMADWQPQRWRMNAQQMQQPETPMPKMPPTQHTQPIGQPQFAGGPFQRGFQPHGPYGGFMPPFAGQQGEQPQWGYNGPRPQQQGFGWNPQNGPNWLEMMGGWRR